MGIASPGREVGTWSWGGEGGGQGLAAAQQPPQPLQSCPAWALAVAGNCSWTAWAPWEPCSRSCGVGQQRRLRAYRPPGPVTLESPTCLQPTRNAALCNLRACPGAVGGSLAGLPFPPLVPSISSMGPRPGLPEHVGSLTEPDPCGPFSDPFSARRLVTLEPLVLV